MIDRRIKIRHLQCFAEVVRHGSLKAAADRLGLTQPAMSRTLSELEDILGTRIIQRHRSGATLTPAGDVFWGYVRTSLAALQQGVDGLGQISAQGGGTLTIGALPSVAASLVPRVAQRFQEQGLTIGLRIHEGAHADLIDGLHDGVLDVVIGRLGSLDRMQGLTFGQLYAETVVFVVRPDHPLGADATLPAIIDYPVICPPAKSAIQPLVESFFLAEGIGDIPNRIESVSAAFGRAFVLASDAVWIISRGVVANDIAAGQLRALPIDAPSTRGPIGLIARSDQTRSPNLDALETVIRTLLAEEQTA